MTTGLLVLLVGSGAAVLAPRLEASGYQPLAWSAGAAAAMPARAEIPVAAILALDQADRIPDLRARFGAMPILLDVENDSVEARELCLSAGADDFWLSSLGTSDLLQRLRCTAAFRPAAENSSACSRWPISAWIPPVARSGAAVGRSRSPLGSMPC